LQLEESEMNGRDVLKGAGCAVVGAAAGSWRARLRAASRHRAAVIPYRFRPGARGLVLAVGMLALSSGCGGRTSLLGAGDGAAASGDGRPPRPDQRGDGASLSVIERSVRACVVAASCLDNVDGGYPAAVASGCIDAFGRFNWFVGGYGFGPDDVVAERLLACVEKARSGAGPVIDCGVLRTCTGGTWFNPGLSMCREGGYCAGNVMRGGGPGGPTLDCGSYAATCVDLPTGAQRACCTKQLCAGEGLVSCQGTQATLCMLGVEHVIDCAATGRTCVPQPVIKVDPCGGTGAPCDITQKPMCQGTSATYCAAGKLATTVCGASPYRGACDPSSYVPCKPAGAECTPDFKGECDPSQKSVVVCRDGRRQVVSCTALGFEVCHGAGGKYGARCGYYE
jgi:hypothetical protein